MVESTYNWDWLVDGFMDAGYRLHLANPAAIQQYSGLKYTDDHSDARWLAHLLRHAMIHPSFIPPRPLRELRDLTRRRERLNGAGSAEKNRVQKVLEDANVKLVMYSRMFSESPGS